MNTPTYIHLKMHTHTVRNKQLSGLRDAAVPCHACAAEITVLQSKESMPWAEADSGSSMAFGSSFRKSQYSGRVIAWQTRRYLQTQCGVNFFIPDSRRVLAPAPKVLGPKHISNPDFAPF